MLNLVQFDKSLDFRNKRGFAEKNLKLYEQR